MSLEEFEIHHLVTRAATESAPLPPLEMGTLRLSNPGASFVTGGNTHIQKEFSESTGGRKGGAAYSLAGGITETSAARAEREGMLVQLER
jgi:hypothetical protein